MKAEAIKMIKGPYGLNYVKTAKSKVFLPIEMKDEMYNKIQPEMENLEYFARAIDKPIYFYPKSDKLTLMNMGTLTTALDNDLPQGKIAAKMYEHMSKVNKALS